MSRRCPALLKDTPNLPNCPAANKRRAEGLVTEVYVGVMIVIWSFLGFFRSWRKSLTETTHPVWHTLGKGNKDTLLMHD